MEAEATANNPNAIGYNTKATIQNSLALGANSLSNRDKGVAGYNFNQDTPSKGREWYFMAATVSVGTFVKGSKEHNVTRQITSVAADSDDADAVNVAQLKSAI